MTVELYRARYCGKLICHHYCYKIMYHDDMIVNYSLDIIIVITFFCIDIK